MSELVRSLGLYCGGVALLVIAVSMWNRGRS